MVKTRKAFQRITFLYLCAENIIIEGLRLKIAVQILNLP